MRYSSLMLVGTALFLISGVPAFAGDSAAVPASATTSNDSPDLDKIVCKSMEPITGTRIGSRRVCHTQGEWNDITDQARKNLEKTQTSQSNPQG